MLHNTYYDDTTVIGKVTWYSVYVFTSEMEDTPLEFTLSQRQSLERVQVLMKEDDEAALERPWLYLFMESYFLGAIC